MKFSQSNDEILLFQTSFQNSIENLNNSFFRKQNFQESLDTEEG